MKPLEHAREGTRALTVAARSIAAASGASVEELVHERALRHYGEGLRQYLMVRTGSIPRAERAWQRVCARSATEPLGEPPGARARLYRLARQSAGREGPPETGDDLPWRPPREVDATVLDRLRGQLTEDEAELLELRHARELGPDEIAFVVDRPVDRVLQELEAAAERAAELLPADVALRAALLEAFALGGAPAATANAEPAAELTPGTVLGNRYAVQERVGTGAFGDVYRAQDTEVPGHVVALKILHEPARTDETRSAALRELHLIASVFHPSVVQFKDHGWHGGRLWFVMPWYEGETLEERIRRRPLERGEARRIFEPLARALAAMHAAGIRHQDVKPDNIFLARIPGFGGRNGGEQVLPVLLDLGVAAKEAEMVVAGTPTYFAPEVAAQFCEAEDRPAVGPRADVFALALSLRNALEPETQPDVPAGAIERFIEERSRNGPPMPEGRELRYLAPTLRRWMNVDPDVRPDADELAEELAILTRPEERRRRIHGVLRWAAPAAIALLAVFAAVVFGLHTRAERQELRAERARRAEAGLRQDLSMSKERRRSLESRVREVRGEYEQSRLSRKQMAAQLARMQGEREMVAEQLAEARQRITGLRGEIERREGELEQRDQELATTRDRLAAERQAAERATARSESLRAELTSAQDTIEGLQGRMTELDGALEATRTRLAAERAKSDRLEAEMTRAVTARARAEAALRRERSKHDSPSDGADAADGADAKEPQDPSSREPAGSAEPGEPVSTAPTDAPNAG